MIQEINRRSLLGLLGATFVLVSGGVSLQACSEEKSAAPDRGVVLAALVDVVILPMLAELRSEIDELPGAINAFTAQPSPETLLAVRNRWASAHGAFRRTMAFGVGPTDDIAITGGVLDEPTVPAQLAELISAVPPPDLTKIQSSSAGVRGFLAIEALLFEVGVDGATIVDRFVTDSASAGRSAALSAISTDLHTKIIAVVESWTTGGFSEQIRTAGNGSIAYKAQRDAFDALLNQTLAIADRVLNILRKSAGITLDDPMTPVSDQSDHTLDDILNDLKGIEAIYTGVWGGKSGTSIASVVAEVNKGADTSLRDALAVGFSTLTTFSPPLRGAQADRSTEVDALLTSLRRIRTTLATETFNALGVSVGISDKDGD